MKIQYEKVFPHRPEITRPEDWAKMPLFGHPYMGGMDRKGAIVSGSREEIREEVERIMRGAPDRFILGADCTVPNDTDWDNIRTAISTAHEYRR